MNHAAKEWREFLHEYGYPKARTYFLLGYSIDDELDEMAN